MRKNGDFVFLRPVLRLGIGMMAALCVACEKPVLDEAPTPPGDGEANVVLHFKQFEGDGFVAGPAPGSFQTRATRAATELTGTFWGANAQAEVEAALATLTDGGISGWDVPDRDEARLIFDARGSIGGLTHASYLCENSGYKCFRLGSSVASFSATSAPAATSDTALRAVATVTIAKE